MSQNYCSDYNDAIPWYSRRLELLIMDISDQLGHETNLVFLNKIPSDCVRSLAETKALNNKVQCLNSEQC